MSDFEQRMDTVTGELKGAIEAQDKEIKQYGETSKELREQIATYEKKYDELQKELRDKTEELAVKMNRPVDRHVGVAERKSVGQRFLGSEEYKSAVASGRNSTDAVTIGNLFERKAVVSGATVGDTGDRAPVAPMYVPELFFDPGQRELTIRDIMNTAPTGSNAIKYFQETDAFEDGSAAAQDGETNTKAQLEINFTEKTASVETISAWVPASRQVLGDQPMLQSHIDNRLIYKVLKEMEDQVIFGDGTNGSLLGIHNTAGVQTVGAPASTAEAGVLTHIRKAFAQVRVNEYAATAIILNPTDWADLETAVGSNGQYIWTNVPMGGQSMLWRVPVVESTVMEEGRFLTGAFGLGAQLWDRELATVRVAEQHSDFFVRNAVAILAELQVALTVYRPKSFVKGTLNDDIAT